MSTLPSRSESPGNVYTVLLEVRVENLNGDPRYAHVANAVRRHTEDALRSFNVGPAALTVKSVHVDLADD